MVTALDPSNLTDGDIEVVLDIDVAGSVAQGATIAVYFTTWSQDGWVEGVSKAVHDAINAPSVLSISWGWAEHQSVGQVDWTDGVINDVSTRFREAAAMGVTVLVASGDDGSDCKIGDGKAHVNYPASDPYVTACGGTTINGGWGHNDLTDRAHNAAPAAAKGSPLDGYATGWKQPAARQLPCPEPR